MRWVYFGAIMIAVILLAIWSMLGLATESNNFYEEMKKVKLQAEDAETIKELDAAWTYMYNVNKNKAFHRSHREAVIEVKAILVTKYKALGL